MKEMMSYLGDEYPSAIKPDGVRMPLVNERRWTRTYATEDRQRWHIISRFMDGSAAITFEDFAREWSSWSDEERHDFRTACSWLSKQDDFPEILRYIMRNGGPKDWRGIATLVGCHLPQDEAFDFLRRAMQSVDLVDACNISQGISLTKHPDAQRLLREHLAELWSHPSLWEDDKFNNWFAYGATCCIEHLIAVGAPPEDLSEQVKALAKHPCAGNRDSCRRFLAKHFSWLNETTDAAGNP
jgi:hypothetical protein